MCTAAGRGNMGVLSVRQRTAECVPFDFYCVEEKNLNNMSLINSCDR